MTRTFNSYKGLTLRNSKVFLKDKTTVFFSMLTQIIILGLFLLFIKQSYLDGIDSALGALKDKVDKADGKVVLSVADDGAGCVDCAYLAGFVPL